MADAADDDPLIEEPNHLKNLAEGWSWMEIVGGPKDGERSYFKGRPLGELGFIDPSIADDAYKPGDLCHRYRVGLGPDGFAVYKWAGTFKGG